LVILMSMTRVGDFMAKFFNNRKRKRSHYSILSQFLEEADRQIKTYLDMTNPRIKRFGPLVSVTCLKLKSIQNGCGIRTFLNYSDYFVVTWAVKHENKELLECLISLIRPEEQLLLFEHDDYECVEDFVARTLVVKPVKYLDVRHDKCYLLELFCCIDEILLTKIHVYTEMMIEQHVTNYTTCHMFLDDTIRIAKKNSRDMTKLAELKNGLKHNHPTKQCSPTHTTSHTSCIS